MSEQGRAWFTEPQLDSIAEQPFFSYIAAGVLRKARDQDWKILVQGRYNYVDGLPLGVDMKLPRTPAVFSRKVRWRKYDDSEAQHIKENYSTVTDNVPVLREQFEQDAQEGMMCRLHLDEAKIRWPHDRLRIAALGSIQKGDDSFRILHDGTHGVQVNNAIRQRDQINQPGAAEERFLQYDQQTSAPGVHFVLKSDASKAHRRFKVVEEDWGYQACSLELPEVWINQVGTFGIATAAYWWGRLVAALGRIGMYLQRQEYVWTLLFADDFKQNAHGPIKYFNLLLFLLIMSALGMPFSLKKCVGGIECDWVGYWCDYKLFQVGLSDSRCQWLCSWIRRQLSQKTTVMRDFVEGLGRMGFAAQVLDRMRPFLAPLYSWSSAIPEGTRLNKPFACSDVPEVRLQETFHAGRSQSFN